MYSYDECLRASVDYFDGNDLGASAWVDKYALKNKENQLVEKTPADMHKRMAREFARIEKNKFKNPLTEDQLFRLFDKFKRLIPQGGMMYGLGNPYQIVSLGNCYILAMPGDSYASISYLDAQIAQISCRRGGCGWNMSPLRPKGLSVQNAAKSTSGAVSFMPRYSHTIQEVCTSGRRGASLQAMHVNHPEIMDFITVKRNKDAVTGSNISVQFTDEFMHNVIKNKNHLLKWPIDAEGVDVKIQEEVAASDVWKEFIIGARDFAEPGVQFIDTVHRESTCYHYGKQFREIASNPCCISGDTLITTESGYVTIKELYERAQKNIANINNLHVVSFNVNTQQMEWKPILNVWQKRHDKTVTLNISIDEDAYSSVECSADHKFYTKNRGYVRADQLTKDDIIVRINKNHNINSPDNSIIYISNGKLLDITYHDIIKPLYDIEVQDNHNFVANDILIKNSEQMGPAYLSCRLFAINLLTYVKHPYTKDAVFDYQSFYSDCKLLQRIADDSVDLELECIDKIIAKIESDPEPKEVKQVALDLWDNIKKMAILDRRTGCGFTALGDTLAALGMEYSADESLKEAEKIQQYMKWACYESSVDMAEEIGAFSLYDPEIDIKSAFIQRLRDDNPELYERMTKFGRRNMVLLTLAPTGTVSCLTNTTSGIEPVFKYEYIRRKKIIPGDKNFRVDFTDNHGDTWQHFNVLHKGLQDWLAVNPGKTAQDSPYAHSQANDIPWQSRIAMQAALQKHIDNSISITINLPSDVSYEIVGEIYKTAWQSGCKGCTVYREGCRDGVLIDKNSIHKEFPEKRPREVDCDVHHVSVKGQQYFVAVGKIGGEIYEIFVGRNGVIPHGVKTGKIIRKRKGFYQLLCYNDKEDEILLSPITAFGNDIDQVISRLISSLLRNKVSINDIITQLEKVGDISGDFNSIGKILCRTLKKYIKDGTIIVGETCPTCGGQLVRQEGCASCPCGYSKCS
jgi:ribonucleotide reductase alpha subunit